MSNVLCGMRSLAVVAVGMVLSTSMLTSCKKEEAGVNPVKRDVFRKATQSESVVVKNSQDEKDEVVRKASLVFAKAFREVIKDRKDWQKSMIEETKKNSLLQLEVGPFREKHPDFKAAYDAALEKYAGEQFPVPNTDIFVYVSGMLTYDQSYVPVFVIPNLDKLNPALDPVVSPGLEMDADLDPMSEDEILAYEEDDDSSFDEIQISESEAKAAVTPIFIFSNGVPSMGISLATTVTVNGGGSILSSRGPGDIVSNSVRVKDLQYRYEASGQSDYAVIVGKAVINSTGFDPWQYIPGFTNVDFNIDARLSKTEILNARNISSNYKTIFHKYGSSTINSANLLFTFCTYEYDWYASPKPIGNGGTVGNNPNTIQFFGRRVYASEVYIDFGNSFTDYDIFQAPGKILAVDNVKTTYTIKYVQ